MCFFNLYVTLPFDDTAIQNTLYDMRLHQPHNLLLRLNYDIILCMTYTLNKHIQRYMHAQPINYK